MLTAYCKSLHRNSTGILRAPPVARMRARKARADNPYQWRLRDILLSTEAMLMIDCVAAIALFAYMLVVTWNSMAPSASDYLLLRGSAKVKVCKEVACLLARLH